MFKHLFIYLCSYKTIKTKKIMANTTKWVIDPMHSEIQFKVKHLVISTVSGFFKSFEGTLETEKEDFDDSTISFSLDIDSIDTNQSQRDEHLKSADFFDAAQFPHITFKSTSFKKTDDDEFELAGDLTIKGVTKPVKLAAEYGGSTADFYGNIKAGFEVTGKINRKDFGLTWEGVTEAGSIVVGEDIKLTMNVQFAKQA
jgi:polyisoprenoid-binding protein YceI